MGQYLHECCVLCRYPIDWEPASRRLRILFGNDASITCVVHVPVEYPHAGVTLVHLSNAPHGFNPDLLNVSRI